MTRLALGLLALATLLPLTAQAPRPERRPQRGPEDAAIARRLGLSPEQTEKLKPLQATHREALKAKHDALKAAHEALQTALKDPATPVDKLTSLHKAQSDLRFDLLCLQREHQEAVRALLTPEQREKAAALMGRMEGRREALRGRDRRGPGGAGFGQPFMAGHEGHPGFGPMGRGPSTAPLASLGLEDAQRTRLAEIRGRHAATLIPLQEQARQAARRLAQALQKPGTPIADLKPLHEAASQKQLEVLLAHRTQRQELEAVLTPAQREALAKARPHGKAAPERPMGRQDRPERRERPGRG